jgi:predicted hotdog family 3-hydroxylacyl-ACP dehydratase
MSAIERADLMLEDLLPHRGAMLLVGQVLEVDAIHAVTLSTVLASWPLTDARGAESLICVELAAQTAGVCNGWDRIQTQGRDSDQMGWLVAVKRADFFIDRLPLGSRVEARSENTLVFDKFREITSELHQDGQLVASVVLQLYQA